MFKGADNCIVRLALARGLPIYVPKAIPSFALKMLRDKRESANFMAILGGTVVDPTLNWFSSNIFSQAPVPPTEVDGVPVFFKTRLSEPSDYIGQLGLSEMATLDQDGRRTGQPVFPWRVRLEPSGDYKTSGPDYFTSLQAIPAGAHLYDVYATDKPCELGGTE